MPSAPRSPSLVRRHSVVSACARSAARWPPEPVTCSSAAPALAGSGRRTPTCTRSNSRYTRRSLRWRQRTMSGSWSSSAIASAGLGVAATISMSPTVSWPRRSEPPALAHATPGTDRSRSRIGPASMTARPSGMRGTVRRKIGQRAGNRRSIDSLEARDGAGRRDRQPQPPGRRQTWRRARGEAPRAVQW